MSDSEYQSDFDLALHESPGKRINRYKKSTLYGRRSRSKRSRSRRSGTFSASESNPSTSHSYPSPRSRTSSEAAAENRTTIKITESLERASQYITSPKSAQIFELSHLQEQLAATHLCSGGHFIFIADIKSSEGLYHKNGLKCSVCQNISPFTNYKSMPTGKIQEPNQRLYVANTITGLGYDNLSLIMATLCLKIPHKSNFVPQVLKTYDSLNTFVKKHFDSIIEKIRSSHNVPIDDLDSVVNIAISIDGTWKKRGHVSQYGIVFIIEMDTGLALDFEVLSSRCEKCEKNQRDRSPHDFRTWFVKHKSTCERNWDGTAKGMETEGTKRLFKRSLAKGLRYKWMICDGDSNAYEAVKSIYLAVDEEDDDASGAEDEGEHQDHGTEEEDDDVVCETDGEGEYQDYPVDDGDEHQGYRNEEDEHEGYNNEEEDEHQGYGSEGEDEHQGYDNAEKDGEDVDEAEGEGEQPDYGDGEREGNEQQNQQQSHQHNLEEDYCVIKEDCINHVQKRVSSRLKDIRTRYSHMELKPVLTNTTQQINSKRPTKHRKLLADGKPYSGSAGRMTKEMEQKFTSLYGNAIREASGQAKEMDLDEDEAVEIMQHKCCAVFYHYIDQTDQENQHYFCPKGPNSWCKYQAGKSLGNVINRKHEKKNRLDTIFLDILKDMIDALTSKDLLRRCLRGATQNSNECLNSIVWSILSKTKNHGYRSIRGAAALACLYFNQGRCGLIDFFKHMGIDINDEFVANILGKDQERLQKATIAAQKQNDIRKRKKQLRFDSAVQEANTSEYGAGRH